VTLDRRLAALLIDGVLCAPIALLIARPPSQLYSVAVGGVFVLERIVLTAFTGHSFGQRMVGVAVRRLDGKPVGLVRAAIRTVLLYAAAPVFFVDKQGRGLHDRAAGTMLVRSQAP
jgi:uncharacterized RDD family membrane protein YckC